MEDAEEAKINKDLEKEFRGEAIEISPEEKLAKLNLTDNNFDQPNCQYSASLYQYMSDPTSYYPDAEETTAQIQQIINSRNGGK
jgi:hypothetical protein